MGAEVRTTMVQINMSEREITVKVVYYGPALSGKTTNLQQIHKLIQAGSKGKMVTLDTADDRTLYFDATPARHVCRRAASGPTA